MTTKSRLYLGVAALAIAVVMTGSVVEVSAQQSAPAAVAIDNDDIGGVVTGANGPEAGVWVIAETTDLPTRYAKMVVTDDQGRYVVPDLPKAKYKVWVRGYGLVDSAKVDGEPGKQLNLTAVAAPNEAAAAKYYPAIYWYSMLKIPDASQFGKKDGDIPDKVKQSDWLNLMKNNGCVGCHQLGQLSTRTFPPGLGEFSSHAEAWVRRTQAGQSGELMVNILAGQLSGAPIKYFADWTERVAKGELPKTKPTRPQGVERNVVVTTWDWGDPKKYLHDLIASDRRDPTVNAYGPLFGQPEYSTDVLPILDPKTHTVTNFQGAGARCRYPRRPWTRPCRHGQAARAFAVLGRGEALRHQGQQPQRHVRPEGARVVGGGGARSEEPGLLQEGLRPSLGQAVPAGADPPCAGDHRAQDTEVHLRRHLLPDPSSAVRLRRQQHAVDQ